LQRSSTTSSEAASTAPLKIVETRDVADISIRYAETDEEICAIHRFLMIVAKPAMRCPINIEKSLLEIIRVAKYEAAIMVMHNDIMVGTMGIIKPTWWYGDGAFLTDRWHFVLPAFMHTPTAARLKAEALDIARIAGLEFIDQGKLRERNGVHLMMPRAYPPEAE
jgi:hypothetical protein